MPDLSIVFAVFSTVHVTVSSPSVARKPTGEGGFPILLFFDYSVVAFVFCRLNVVGIITSKVVPVSVKG